MATIERTTEGMIQLPLARLLKCRTQEMWFLSGVQGHRGAS